MAHFAEVDDNNVVLRVIVIGNDDCKDSDGNESEAVGIAFCKELLGTNTNWVQTSYNNNIRHRYAVVGYTYDQANNVFIPPQPYSSWSVNTDTWDWEPPTPMPVDGGFHEDSNTFVSYEWNEGNLSWDRNEEAVEPAGGE